MHRNWLAAGVLATLAASVMAADLDLSDFDDDLMQSMDDAIKELDSNVGGQDAKASLANAEVLRDGPHDGHYRNVAPRSAHPFQDGRDDLALPGLRIEPPLAHHNGVRARQVPVELRGIQDSVGP